MLVDISTLLRLRSSSSSLKAPIPGSVKEISAGIKQQLPQVGTGAAKITNKKYPRAGTQIFFEKIACAETAEPRMTVPYTTYRNCLNSLKRRMKMAYYQTLCLNLKNNTKKLWEIINVMIGKSTDKSCILEKLKVGNIVCDSSTDMANTLGSYFATVGTKFANAIKPPLIKVTDYIRKIKRNPNSLFLTPTNSTEISQLIRALPNKNSSGYDQINNKLLKLIGSEISKPLAIIFNESLSTRNIPRHNENGRGNSIVQRKMQV